MAARAKPSRFFKIVFDPQEHRLKIPAEFVKRYGNNLPDIVFLKPPAGLPWKVELLRSGNEFWLQKGWQEFEEHYSIGFGHFLVFEYKENGQFEVIILDMTASEIEYPFDANYGRGDINREDEMDDIGSQSHDSVVKTEEEIEATHSLERGLRAAGRTTWKAYQRAKIFKSNNPSKNPFFICVMHPTYVSQPFTVNVPRSFAERNLPNIHNSTIKVCVEDGKTWPVKCHVYQHICKTSMGCGWRKFVEDNNLKVGDVCIFEVMKSMKLVWNVTIFRR